MFRISSAQPASTDTAAANPFSGRGSSSQKARGTDSTSAATTNQGLVGKGEENPDSFASHLKVWDAFTGAYYNEGEVPKTVLHTQGSTPAVTASATSGQTATSFSAQGMPESIRLDGVNPEAVSVNSARSVTTTNAIYNREATEEYAYQLQNWKDNDGRRWLNGQWTKTDIPPPPPILKETVFDKVLEQIRAGKVSSTPIPYYMGNPQAGQIYDYNAPLSYDNANTTTFEVSATGQA